MKLDTSAAPELALLAAPPAPVAPAALVAGAAVAGAAVPGAVVPRDGWPGLAGRALPATTGPAGEDQTGGGAAPASPAGPVTIGYLAACLRFLVADPRRWWDLVRFDPRRPVRVPVAAPAPGCENWLLVLPPGHGEHPVQAPRGGLSCLVAGAVTEQAATAAGWQDRPLVAGRTQVHGGCGPSQLINSGTGYAVTLHARPLPG
jgi:hypothetical protein